MYIPTAEGFEKVVMGEREEMLMRLMSFCTFAKMPFVTVDKEETETSNQLLAMFSRTRKTTEEEAKEYVVKNAVDVNKEFTKYREYHEENEDTLRFPAVCDAFIRELYIKKIQDDAIMEIMGEDISEIWFM